MMDELFSLELSHIQAITAMVVEFLVNYSFQVIGTLLILIISFVLTKNCRMFLSSKWKNVMSISPYEAIPACYLYRDSVLLQ